MRIVRRIATMNAMRSRRLARALPVGLLAVALLAACGDETGADDEAGGRFPRQQPLTSRTLGGIPLDNVQATSALLTIANVPGFEDLGPSSPDEGPVETDGKSGCESEDSFDDRFDRARIASTRVDTAYLYGDEARLLIVTSLVASFANEDQAQAAYDEALADYGSCTHYEDTGDAGDTSVVDVESNTDTVSDDVDDQLNLVGVGTWDQPGYDTTHMGFGLSLARVGNNATMTQVISIGVADDRLLLEPYTEIAVDRLLAVMNGETPEDVAGPAVTPVPASHLALPSDSSTFERYFDTDPRFSLPD